jgi:hypothetical protein
MAIGRVAGQPGGATQVGQRHWDARYLLVRQSVVTSSLEIRPCQLNYSAGAVPWSDRFRKPSSLLRKEFS